jgi:predicted ATP-grasp superfamily ATP-dependent carboligase
MQPPAPSPLPQQQPLAIVGASVRAAAASAVRAGFLPLAADLFADVDLRAIATATRISPYPEGLLDWLRTVEPAAWMYTGALENHPELIDQMAWVAPLWGNTGDVLARVRSPWELAGALHDAGLLFPETRENADGLPHDGSWLAKTYRGASGSGVRELSETRRQGDTETRREPAIGVASESPCLPLSLSPCLCYQRRVAGTPCAAVFVAAQGSASLLGVTRQLVGEAWLGAHGFQYAGSIGPWPVSEVALATITRIGKVIAEQFELLGLFGVDMVIEADNVWTIEVNPRYTASVEIVERVTNIQAIAMHAAACNNSQLPNIRVPAESAVANATHCHGKAVLFSRRDIEISKQIADATLAGSLKKPWPSHGDISLAGTPIQSGRPILTLFAEGDTVDEVECQLRERAMRMEHELEVHQE